MTGLEMIVLERSRQINSEGFDESHDDAHTSGELIRAAESYLLAGEYASGAKGRYKQDAVKAKPPSFWPWEREWWKPSPDPIRNLVKAGALIAAEIDRLSRGRALEGQA